MQDLYAVRLIFFISKCEGIVQDRYAVRLLIFFISKSDRRRKCKIFML